MQGTQTSTTIAGISGSPVTGSAVFVDSTGKLGVQVSSERFKADIAAMPEVSAKLEQLRPVTFHYKSDPQGVPQYGLIAEEVDQVSPELVIRDGQGKIQGVHYEELTPMLLKEVQTQRATIESQGATIASQGATIESQAATIASQAARKADRVEALLADSGVISVQVLNEFTAVACRKLAMPVPEVREILQTVRDLCRTEPVTVEDHDRAVQVMQRSAVSRPRASPAAADG